MRTLTLSISAPKNRHVGAKSATKRVNQQLFYPSDQLRRPLAKESARALGEIPDGVPIITEDVMVEHVSPRRQLVRWQVPHRDDRVIERVKRGQKRWLAVAPPEIDQR